MYVCMYVCIYVYMYVYLYKREAMAVLLHSNIYGKYSRSIAWVTSIHAAIFLAVVKGTTARKGLQM